MNEENGVNEENDDEEENDDDDENEEIKILQLLEAPSQVATITCRKHFFFKIPTAFQNNENNFTEVTFVVGN